jgi:hypothetical protein
MTCHFCQICHFYGFGSSPWRQSRERLPFPAYLFGRVRGRRAAVSGSSLERIGMSKIILLGTLFLTAAATAPAHAQFPARLRAGDAQLVLNGTGARSKYLMQMYEAGLYLLSPSGDAGAIVAADGPMAIRLHITSGLVTQEKLVESLNEGFENSTGGKPETLSKEIG